MKPLRWVTGVFAAAALCGALVWFWPRTPEAVVDHQQREAIADADTARQLVERKVPVARRKTDTAIADTSRSREEIKSAVEEERSLVDSTLKAADVQIQTRDDRIKTLEKRSGGKVFLFSEVGVSSPLDRPKLGFEAQAGVAVRLDPHTKIQLGVTTEKELQLSVRRELRLF